MMANSVSFGVSNMVRGMLAVVILPLFKFLRGYTSYYHAGWITALIIMLLSIFAVINIKETFGKDLDFIEE